VFNVLEIPKPARGTWCARLPGRALLAVAQARTKVTKVSHEQMEIAHLCAEFAWFWMERDIVKKPQRLLRMTR
jgi:hypothetical protein